MSEIGPPRVFVSYSHDSADHKRWVSELCTRLRNDGIDIILDQWDLSLGEDITKFMEVGLVSSDRVLLICTENYVRKADAGEGGVAYERMIVTAELIQNLGTQKFIPIVRQGEGEHTLPAFMGARFYVNLGPGSDFEAQYDLLIRELHKEPIGPKPPLGKNPFAKQPSGTETPSAPSGVVPLADLLVDERDTIKIYDTALEVARQGDLVAWRRLIKLVRSKRAISLQSWREERKLDEIRDPSAMPPIMDEAVSLYVPIFEVSLAGIQSGRDKFRDQRAVIDELMSPRGWVSKGNSAVDSIPGGLVFAFQALYGAACLDTNQLEIAIQLGLTRIAYSDGRSPSNLIHMHGLIGWPPALGKNSRGAWDWLMKAAQRWPWLLPVFINEEDYQVALTAYYMALSILELALIIQAGEGDLLLKQDIISLDVPPCFLYNDEVIFTKAYRHLLRSNPKVLWESLGISIDAMKKYWPIWVGASKTWVANVYDMWFEVPQIYSRFLEAI